MTIEDLDGLLHAAARTVEILDDALSTADAPGETRPRRPRSGPPP